MKFVRIYWNVAAVIGTVVIILYVGDTVVEAARWIATTLDQLANN